MKWGVLVLTLAWSLLAVPAQGQVKVAQPTPVDPVTEIAALGLTVVPVPGVLYEQLQSAHLKPGMGVVIDQVLPRSAAAQVGLKRYDILLSFQKTPVRDTAHFAQLLRAAPPDRKAPLLVLRGGKEVALEAGLSTKLLAVADPTEPPRGLIKPDGPPAVHVVAKPLEGGKMNITFTYYSEGKGRLERLTCSGSLDQIQEQVRTASTNKQMPAPVRELVDATLKRIRTLNAQP